MPIYRGFWHILGKIEQNGTLKIKIPLVTAITIKYHLFLFLYFLCLEFQIKRLMSFFLNFFRKGGNSDWAEVGSRGIALPRQSAPSISLIKTEIKERNY